MPSGRSRTRPISNAPARGPGTRPTGRQGTYWRWSSGWAFRYVFVSPWLIHDHNLRYHAFALEAVDRLLDGYHPLLTAVYQSDLRLDPASFDRQLVTFRDRAREAVRVVHWDAFGKVLMGHRPHVWDDYFDRIVKRCRLARPEWNTGKVVQSIKKSLHVAGMDFRG